MVDVFFFFQKDFKKKTKHFIESLVSISPAPEITSIKLLSISQGVIYVGVGSRRGKELKANREAQKILRITYKQPVEVKLATF